MGEFVILYFFFEAALQRLFVVVACVCFFIYIFKYIIKHCGSCVYLFSLNTSVFSEYLLCPYVSITRYLLFVLTTFFLLLFSSCFDTILFFLIEKSQKKKNVVYNLHGQHHIHKCHCVGIKNIIYYFQAVSLAQCMHGMSKQEMK